MKKTLSFKTLLLLLCFIIQACSSDNSDNENPQNINTDDYLYFISGKINGEDFLFGLETEPTSIEYSSIFGNSGVCTNDNSDYSGIGYNSGVYPYNSTGSSIVFNFVRFYLCSNPKTKVEVFNDSFPIKTYPLSETDSNISGADSSIAISYSPDINEDIYYTSFNGNSVNGSFTITKSTEKNEYLLNQLIEAYQEIEGTFTATLYKVDDSSDTIQITDGKFKLQVKLL